ncbi:benzoate 4-monooxygenase cytochrome P450 [Trichoderma sp. SZMC 28011]
MWYFYDYYSQIAILAMGMVISCILVLRGLYRILRGHLRHVPGPLLSKITNMHLAMYDFSYSRNDQILEWHHQYGPIICIAPNEVSVATLEATKEIYSATQRWPKSNYFDNFKGYNRRSIFATKSHEEHRAKRKLTSKFYQASNMYTVPAIEQHIQERCQTVLRQIRPGTQVDIYRLADCYALDIITFLVLGPHHCTQSVENVCLERQILMDLKRLQFVGPLRLRCPILFDYVSKLLDTLSPGLAYLRAEDRLASWCQQRISAAMEDPNFENSRSLLQHILANLQNVGPKQSTDHLYVAAEILDNINAAEATVAVTATYLVWKLTEHPEWQQKIRKELNALAVQENGLISFADVNSQVPSLEACLKEVYRLHPASSGRSERLVPKGGRTLSNIYLPEGTIVTNSLAALHRDENIFPNSDHFLPERWLDGDEEMLNRRLNQLIPFGYGGRVCLGKALATMEIKLLIAGLYRKYKTVMTESSTHRSMRQCSTHDAVPWGLKCVIECQLVDDDQ